MVGFVYELMDAGIPVSVQYVMEFFRALRDGLATNLDQLFLLSRLIFVKRVEHYDAFEQVFAHFFLGTQYGRSVVEWEELLQGKPFRQWLQREIEQGRLSLDQIREMDTEELLQKFWETLLKQKEAHHGGGKWVGTGGTSPYGHSGRQPGGIRVHGQSLHGSASKVIDARRYINYSDKTTLGNENLRQVLTSLKSLQPTGPETELNVDETIYRTARNGGEIELVFGKELRDRLKLVILMDNGGYSMMPYVPLVRTIFTKIRDQFKDVSFYYFHNCVYGTVYSDVRRTRPVKWEAFLNESSKSRLIIIGDANMAPSELMAAYGSIDIATDIRKPGIEWLKELKEAFPVSVWFNPIPSDRWGYLSSTIYRIGTVFHMEDLTLAGIKSGVAYLNVEGKAHDGRR